MKRHFLRAWNVQAMQNHIDAVHRKLCMAHPPEVALVFRERMLNILNRAPRVRYENSSCSTVEPLIAWEIQENAKAILSRYDIDVKILDE